MESVTLNNGIKLPKLGYGTIGQSGEGLKIRALSGTNTFWELGNEGTIIKHFDPEFVRMCTGRKIHN